MKKKLYITLGVLAVLILGALAWYFFRNSENQRDTVPDDATAVMVLDMKELVTEVGIDTDDLQDVDNTTGIDFSKKLYGFATKEGYIGFSAHISDKDDLKKNMSDVTKLRGMTWGMTGSWLTCFDDNKVLFMGPLASMKDDALMNLTTDLMTKESVNCALLDSVELQESPMSMRISLDALPEKVQEYIVPNLPENVELTGTQLVLDSHAQSDRIIINSTMHSQNATVHRLYNDWLSSLQPMTGNLLKQCPQDPVIWIGFGAKGENILQELRKISSLRTMLLGLNLCVDADLMMKAIQGDVAVSVPTLTVHRQTYQLLAELKDSKFLAGSGDWSSKSSSMVLDKLGNNKFCITTPATRIFFGVQNTNLLYLSNSDELTQPESFFSVGGRISELRNQITGAKMFMSVDLGKVLNTAAPMLMMLGYSTEFYSTLEELNRLNIRVADDSQTIEISVKQPIADIVKKWIK